MNRLRIRLLFLNGRLGKASLPKSLTSTPNKKRGRVSSSGRDLSPQGPDANAVSMPALVLPLRTLWKSVPAHASSPSKPVPWPPDMRPFLIICGQARPHWVFPNIKPRRLMILLAADSMIKIITLPGNAAMPGRMAFPGSDEIHHAISRIPTKRDQSVQMVGHHQSQLDPPSTFFMVKCHRLKQLACHCWIVQRCLPSFFAVDRDEKCRVIGDPNRRTMRPPPGLTIGHGFVGHWKNSNCVRRMSKRILKT